MLNLGYENTLSSYELIAHHILSAYVIRMASNSSWKKRSSKSWSRKAGAQGAAHSTSSRDSGSGRYVTVEKSDKKGSAVSKDSYLFSRKITRDVDLPSGGKITYLRKDVLDSALGRDKLGRKRDD